MTQTVNAYEIGQSVRVTARYIQNNVLTDPSEATIMNRDPSGNEASQVYNGGAGNVVKLATGIYYYDLTLDEEGTWYVRAKGTGVIATAEREILCRTSAFDSP